MNDFNRRTFLSAGLGAAAVGVMPAWLQAASRNAGGARRPNVIIVYTDDMDLDEIGCFAADSPPQLIKKDPDPANGRVHTPNMDRLAMEGVKFTHAYAAAAVCTPSRYNMLTGSYASRAHNILEKIPEGSWPRVGWNPQITTETTLPKILKAAGYRTGMVGKWHLGGEPLTPLPKEPEPDPLSPEVQRLIAENYSRTVAAVKHAGFDFADGLFDRNLDGMPLPKGWKVHNQEWMTDCALRFIQESGNNPFFLYFAATIPHSPYGTDWATADPRVTPAGLLDKAPSCQPTRQDALRRAREAGVNDKWAFLTWLDDGIGALLSRVREMGLEKDTLILFMSDNANPAKYTCYDGGARVPAMARWTGRIKPGTVSDAVIANIDYAATAADVCGAPVPPAARLDGVSLRPILDGGATIDRDGLMLEIAYTRGIVTDRFKYVAVRIPPEVRAKNDPNGTVRLNQEGKAGASHYDTELRYPGYFDADQLYDLSSDPAEQKNLAGDPAYAAVLTDMKEKLRKRSKGMAVPFGEFTP